MFSNFFISLLFITHSLLWKHSNLRNCIFACLQIIPLQVFTFINYVQPIQFATRITLSIKFLTLFKENKSKQDEPHHKCHNNGLNTSVNDEMNWIFTKSANSSKNKMRILSKHK